MRKETQAVKIAAKIRAEVASVYYSGHFVPNYSKISAACLSLVLVSRSCYLGVWSLFVVGVSRDKLFEIWEYRPGGIYKRNWPFCSKELIKKDGGSDENVIFVVEGHSELFRSAI